MGFVQRWCHGSTTLLCSTVGKCTISLISETSSQSITSLPDKGKYISSILLPLTSLLNQPLKGFSKLLQNYHIIFWFLGLKITLCLVRFSRDSSLKTVSMEMSILKVTCFVRLNKSLWKIFWIYVKEKKIRKSKKFLKFKNLIIRHQKKKLKKLKKSSTLLSSYQLKIIER